MFKPVIISNNSDMTLWDRFVTSHPQGTPYHLSSWLKTIREAYNFTASLFMEQDDDGVVLSILPFFRTPKPFGTHHLISLPFSDYGGPLFSEKADSSSLFTTAMKQHFKKCGVVEIRGSIANVRDFTPFIHYKRHVLNTNRSLDEIRAGINKKTILHSIKKAEKAGVTVTASTDFQALCEFSRLNTLTRKKHGVPGQPFRFFKILYKNVIEADQGFILSSKHEGHTIASSIFLTIGDTIHYKYNASDPAVLKTLTPNHLMMWTAITIAHERGFKKIDFGRTSPDNEGLMRYKNMWGTECSDIPYYFYPKIVGTSSMKENGLQYSILSMLWKRLPDTFIEKVSPLIYRYLA